MTESIFVNISLSNSTLLLIGIFQFHLNFIGNECRFPFNITFFNRVFCFFFTGAVKNFQRIHFMNCKSFAWQQCFFSLTETMNTKKKPLQFETFLCLSSFVHYFFFFFCCSRPYFLNIYTPSTSYCTLNAHSNFIQFFLPCVSLKL